MILHIFTNIYCFVKIFIQSIPLDVIYLVIQSFYERNLKYCNNVQ